jgi:hypothetical protein
MTPSLPVTLISNVTWPIAVQKLSPYFVFLGQLYTNKRGVVQPPFAFASVAAASGLDRILVQIQQVSMYPMQAGEMCA